ncbi:unnamed protein product [Triticum turgidum subsp. durum]|uniref:CRAL/TRIO N-terminal domain-containing protein n=1 Tax=Triticum turgidum subsp. durum TaxID=4567 RepID=A0A9R1AU49_TRITD|nr:unnamed protein product [Triticum turgidum subsp. durum]
MDFGTDERQHSHGDGGDAAEWKKVVELRAVAEAQDPAAKEEDDFVLRRFLRARDYNIGKASMMLLQYLAWKRVAKPHGSISDEEVRGEIAKKRVDMQGFDRLGRPMAYIYGARHFPARQDLDGFKRYVAYVLDKICTRNMSEDNGPEEPEVGILWSDLHELGVGLAGAALEPGVRAAEHSGLRQARTQACIAVVHVSWRRGS